MLTAIFTKIMRKYLFIVIFASMNLTLYADNLFNLPQRVKFSHLTTRDGLNSDCILRILQDHLGFLWFATPTGLTRFDGYDYKIYTFFPETKPLSQIHIFNLYEDNMGDLWFVGYPHGLFKFERKSGRFVSAHEIAPYWSAEDIKKMLFCYLDSRNNIWIWGNGDTLEQFYLDQYNIMTGEYKRFCLHAPCDTSLGKSELSYNYLSGIIQPCFIKDDSANVWIASLNKGLFCYDHNTDSFRHYEYDPDNPTSLGHDKVTHVCKTEDNQIWVCTEGGGLNHYVRDQDGFRRFQYTPETLTSISSDSCYYTYQDRQGRLWVSVPEGVDCFDPATKLFRHYPIEISPEKLSTDWYMPVFDTHDDYLWVLVDHIKRVLVVLNTHTGNYNLYTEDLIDEQDLWGFYFNDFLADHSGMLWLATRMRGVNKCNPFAQSFNQLSTDNSLLTRDNVTFIMESQHEPDIVYICTTNGLNRYHKKNGQFTFYNFSKNSENIPKSSNVCSIVEDHLGRYWYGTQNGLFRSDPSGAVHSFYHDPQDATSLSSSLIMWLAIHNSRELWIGTGLKGLNLYNLETGENTCFYYDPKDSTTMVPDRWIFATEQDQAGRIWIATSYGLCIFNHQDSTFTRIIEGVNIRKLYCCSRGLMWLGTKACGLGKVNMDTFEISFYNKEHGLPHNEVQGIMEDDNGVLWLATAGGLAKFNPEAEQFRNYFQENGLATDYLQYFIKKLSDGNIYMGSVQKGLVFFDPQALRDNPYPPKMVLTDLKLFNESLVPGPDSPLKQDISVTDEMELAHWQNDVTFVCAALHYSHPENNTYKYILENYNDDWIEAGTRREMSYTNLNPGKYVFRVQGASSDGVRSRKDAVLRLTIHRPWYATIPAYGVYFLILSGMVILIWNNQLRRIKLNHALQLKDAESRKFQEIDQMKTRFLANISHEFRMPLTLILGPVDRWIKRIKDKDLKMDLNVIRSNGERLLKLVNQLLDLSRIESGKLVLHVKQLDIVPFVNRVVQTFESRAKIKNISLDMDSERDSIMMAVDPEKLDDVLCNLLSNALKFTPDGGSVCVSIKCLHHDQLTALDCSDDGCKNGYVQISVTDSGVGIADDDQDKIFDRFYQSGNSFTQSDAGTGIGLALTRELVELHQGWIRVKSEAGKGSTFIVILPIPHVTTGANSDGEVIDHEAQEQIDFVNEMHVKKEEQLLPVKDGIQILIVEDNRDLRRFMVNILKHQCKVLQAADGHEGQDMAVQYMPDLIISDVMMPKTDGFELCHALKTDERTSHIPIILLTARADLNSKIQGLQTGADDYLVKPFNETELKIRVHNCVEQRQKFIQRFKNNALLPLSDLAVTSADERFLERVSEVILNNIADENFGPEALAGKIGLSRSQLHRKLKAIARMTTTAFITSIRLRQAADLLEKKYGTIAEIAYKVGFGNPAYFSACFKRFFGCLPSEFKLNPDK